MEAETLRVNNIVGGRTVTGERRHHVVKLKTVASQTHGRAAVGSLGHTGGNYELLGKMSDEKKLYQT